MTQIALIDDDRNILTSVSIALESEGYEVRTYTDGAAALAAYQSEYDPAATFVPVDIVSGVGTRDSHWSENWAGGAPALMTGFLNAPTYVTQTTIASFEDLGYQVALARATSSPT